MNNHLINIIGLLIGVSGLFIGIYQTINLTKFKNLVKKQGLDIRNRLIHEQDSLSNFRDQLKLRNDVSWPSSKPEVINSINERSENIKLIISSVDMFIEIVISNKVESEK